MSRIINKIRSSAAKARMSQPFGPWIPNNKVIAGAVASGLTLAARKLQLVDLPLGWSQLVAFALVGYLIPESPIAASYPLRRYAATLVAVIASLTLLFSVGASVASANTPQDDYNGYASATYWGASPGCGYVYVYHWTPNGAAGYTDRASCSIYINTAAFTSWPAGRACMIEMHEWGHLLGYGDDYYNQNSVMYYGMDPWRNIPYVRWPCSW
jgi:hypothetical protein